MRCIVSILNLITVALAYAATLASSDEAGRPQVLDGPSSCPFVGCDLVVMVGVGVGGGVELAERLGPAARLPEGADPFGVAGVVLDPAAWPLGAVEVALGPQQALLGEPRLQWHRQRGKDAVRQEHQPAGRLEQPGR